MARVMSRRSSFTGVESVAGVVSATGRVAAVEREEERFRWLGAEVAGDCMAPLSSAMASREEDREEVTDSTW